jgi:signal transduction histidine kinase
VAEATSTTVRGPIIGPPDLSAGNSADWEAPFVAVLSKDGQVQFVNPLALSEAALTQADLSRRALWETRWWDFDEAVQQQVHLACTRAAAGESVRLQLPMRGTSGPPEMVDFTVAPLLGADGAVLQIVASASDAGARTRAERALQASDRRKDEFLAMLAHELRNPLAPLRNAAALMRLTDDGHPQRSALSALVDRQVKHMSRLLDDLLDASRIDQGKIALTLEPVELVSLLAQTLEGMRALMDSRGLQVVLSAPPRQVWLKADPVRITQIMENLLTNAAKFTETQGTIRITLTMGQREARLSVADNGQGIDAELLPRVFDLFTQGARSLDRSQGGLGIGLSLVRNLVMLHGGAVTAASEGHGRGSEFVVTLPLLLQREPGEAPPAAAGAPFLAKRVLVVDDNEDAAESLAELLALKGHETRAVTQSKAALQLATEFEPEVVLLDIGLPRSTGSSLRVFCGRCRTRETPCWWRSPATASPRTARRRAPQASITIWLNR